jgi:hypothetical protein
MLTTWNISWGKRNSLTLLAFLGTMPPQIQPGTLFLKIIKTKIPDPRTLTPNPSKYRKGF